MNTKANARRLQAQAVIIDGHNDHFDAKMGRDGVPLAFMTPDLAYHCDGRRLLQAGYAAACLYAGGNDLRYSMTLTERILEEIEKEDDLLLVRTTADIRRAHRDKKLGVIMIWEGAGSLQGDIALLHLIYRLGVRAIGLTHPSQGGQDGKPHALQGTPSFAGYCTLADRESFRRTAQGLTPFGRQVVRTMNTLGMVVDVAHVNDATFYQTLELSTRPVMFSHGGVFACCHHARGLTDEQIKCLAAKDGVMGISFYDKFLACDRPAALRDIVDQIAYVAELVGVRHVGLGSDFDGLPESVRPVIRGPEQLARLIELLLQRQFRDRDILAILGGNFLRLFKTILDHPRA